VKKYPSCGTTQSSIDAILDLMKEKGVTHETLDEVKVRVTPFTYNLTGKPFAYGENPKISAMYSIQYCVANALLRKSCKLRHFDESSVREPKVMEVIDKIHVAADPALDQRNPRLTEMEVKMKDGATYHKRIASPRGTFENPLTEEELREKLEDCVSYGGKALSGENLKRMVSFVDRLEDEKDVRDLIPLLVSKGRA
jgi:2-methylcitrate dehydratase PrpD